MAGILCENVWIGCCLSYVNMDIRSFLSMQRLMGGGASCLCKHEWMELLVHVSMCGRKLVVCENMCGQVAGYLCKNV